MSRGYEPWRHELQLLWTGQFFVTAGLMALVPILPLYINELGGSGDKNHYWSGMALAAPAISVVVAAPIWGWLSDSQGRKHMVVCAFSIFALSMLFMAIARTPLEFFYCRLLQGACGLVVTIAAFVSAVTPETKRGWALGSLQSATAAGSLIGPLIGGLLVDYYGFRLLLLLTAIITGLSGVMASVILTNTNRGKSRDSSPSRPYKAIVELLRHNHVRLFILAGIFTQAGACGLVTVFAPHVQEILTNPERAATWIGILYATTWGATLLASPWWGKRNDKYPIEKNFAIAACGCGISIVVQAWVRHAELLVLLRIVQGFFFAALLQTVYFRIIDSKEAATVGLNIGAAKSLVMSGRIIGPVVSIYLSIYLSIQWTFLFMGLFFLCAAALVWINYRALSIEH